VGILAPVDAPHDARSRFRQDSNIGVVTQPEESGVLGTYSSFDALPASYSGLFSAAGEKSFFYSRAWFANLARTTLEPLAQIRLFGLETAGENATPLACLVMRSPAGQKGSIFSGRRFDAHSLAGLTTHPTTLFSPLVSESVPDPTAVLSRLLDGMASQKPSCPIFDFNRMDPQSPLFSALVQALRNQGYCVRPYKYCDSPYEPVAGISFGQYLKDRPRDVRVEPGRRLRKLEKSHNVSFGIITGPEGIDQAIETFERVNAASWRKPEPFPDFDAGLLRAAATDGVLHFGTFDIDGETVAVQIWLVSGGSATMFKIAFDERFKKHHVGTLLMSHMIAHMIDEEHVEEIDFGLYANDYKLRWLSQLREIWGIVAFNPRSASGLIALLRYDAEQAFALLKKVCKKYSSVAKTGLAKLPRYYPGRR